MPQSLVPCLASPSHGDTPERSQEREALFWTVQYTEQGQLKVAGGAQGQSRSGSRGERADGREGRVPRVERLTRVPAARVPVDRKGDAGAPTPRKREVGSGGQEVKGAKQKSWVARPGLRSSQPRQSSI